MDNEITKLQQIISNSNNIVFFGGAGVSTESGIPDFRSPGGLYKQKYNLPPERMLSYSFFMSHTEDFYEFYKGKMLFTDYFPNKAHEKLAELEKAGKLQAVVTQNVDGLHRMAGSQNVIELHGSIYRNYCMKCKTTYEIDVVQNSDGVPKCTCGGVIRPDVVLFEDSLDNDVISKAIMFISNADVLIIGGTSLVVYPAASFINYFKGNKLVIINKVKDQNDRNADLFIVGSIGEVLDQIVV